MQLVKAKMFYFNWSLERSKDTRSCSIDFSFDADPLDKVCGRMERLLALIVSFTLLIRFSFGMKIVLHIETSDNLETLSFVGVEQLPDWLEIK